MREFLSIVAFFFCLFVFFTAVAEGNGANVYVHPIYPATQSEYARYQTAAEVHWRTQVSNLQVRWEEGIGNVCALADPPNTIYLRPSCWRREKIRQKCETFVHEFGHLVLSAKGIPFKDQHTTDQTVMDPLRPNKVVRSCRHAPKGIFGFTFERVHRDS